MAVGRVNVGENKTNILDISYASLLTKETSSTGTPQALDISDSKAWVVTNEGGGTIHAYDIQTRKNVANTKVSFSQINTKITNFKSDDSLNSYLFSSITSDTSKSNLMYFKDYKIKETIQLDGRPGIILMTEDYVIASTNFNSSQTSFVYKYKRMSDGSHTLIWKKEFKDSYLTVMNKYDSSKILIVQYKQYGYDIGYGVGYMYLSTGDINLLEKYTQRISDVKRYIDERIVSISENINGGYKLTMYNLNKKLFESKVTGTTYKQLDIDTLGNVYLISTKYNADGIIKFKVIENQFTFVSDFYISSGMSKDGTKNQLQYFGINNKNVLCIANNHGGGDGSDFRINLIEIYSKEKWE